MSGFDDIFKNDKVVVTPGWVLVKDSELTCDKCFEETDSGEYQPQKEVLRFKCPQGHVNIIEGLKLFIE